MSGSTITPWVVGNWKMNPLQADAGALLKNFKQLLNEQNIAEAACHIGVAPTAIALTTVQNELAQASRNIMTVAQDVSRVRRYRCIYG
jgi:Triosephosphate isomerase